MDGLLSRRQFSLGRCPCCIEEKSPSTSPSPTQSSLSLRTRLRPRLPPTSASSFRFALLPVRVVLVLCTFVLYIVYTISVLYRTEVYERVSCISLCVFLEIMSLASHRQTRKTLG